MADTSTAQLMRVISAASVRSNLSDYLIGNFHHREVLRHKFQYTERTLLRNVLRRIGTEHAASHSIHARVRDVPLDTAHGVVMGSVLPVIVLLWLNVVKKPTPMDRSQQLPTARARYRNERDSDVAVRRRMFYTVRSHCSTH